MSPSLLSLEAVTLNRMGSDVPLFDRLNLELYAGQRLAVLGGEAVGKSTLMRLMAGLIQPDAGRVLWAGAPPDPRERRQRRPGVLFRDPEAHFLAHQVAEEVGLGLDGHGLDGAALAERVAAALAWAGLPPELSAAALAGLSAAQRARVALAALHAARPQVLLADEPGASLSDDGEAELAEKTGRYIDEGGGALVVFTSRRDRAARFAATILRLHRGVLVPSEGEMGV